MYINSAQNNLDRSEASFNLEGLRAILDCGLVTLLTDRREGRATPKPVHPTDHLPPENLLQALRSSAFAPEPGEWHLSGQFGSPV